jgi:hypothetical protein
MRWLMTYYQRYRMRLDTPTPSPGDAGREPAFANLASVDLELVDYRVLDGRVLLVEYRPTGRDIPTDENDSDEILTQDK